MPRKSIGKASKKNTTVEIKVSLSKKKRPKSYVPAFAVNHHADQFRTQLLIHLHLQNMQQKLCQGSCVLPFMEGNMHTMHKSSSGVHKRRGESAAKHTKRREDALKAVLDCMMSDRLSNQLCFLLQHSKPKKRNKKKPGILQITSVHVQNIPEEPGFIPVKCDQKSILKSKALQSRTSDIGVVAGSVLPKREASVVKGICRNSQPTLLGARSDAYLVYLEFEHNEDDDDDAVTSAHNHALLVHKYNGRLEIFVFEPYGLDHDAPSYVWWGRDANVAKYKDAIMRFVSNMYGEIACRRANLTFSWETTDPTEKKKRKGMQVQTDKHIVKDLDPNGYCSSWSMLFMHLFGFRVLRESKCFLFENSHNVQTNINNSLLYSVEVCRKIVRDLNDLSVNKRTTLIRAYSLQMRSFSNYIKDKNLDADLAARSKTKNGEPMRTLFANINETMYEIENLMML